MIRINNIKIAVGDFTDDLTAHIAKKLSVRSEDIISYTLVKKAVDARNKSFVHYVCAVNASVKNEASVLKRCKDVSAVSPKVYNYPTAVSVSDKRPLVVGFGPGGMFCALTLARCGLRPIVWERGSAVEKRVEDIMRFQTSGTLNVNSNVQFGEGGAGTFSDGKLTTGIKDIRCAKVLSELTSFGAPDEIMYLAKPHIGTDKLRSVVRNIRNEIIRLGGEIHFDTCLTDILSENGRLCGAVGEKNGEVIQISTDAAVLAIGHSARDTFEMLYNRGVTMLQKPFSVGARIEHSQAMINKSQYGDFSRMLKAADYKLFVHLPDGRSAYTFCMCPGGYVMGAASEKNAVVTNGMSCFARDGENSNSALLVGVQPSDFGSSHPLAGIEFQRKIERAAYTLGGGNYRAPIQLVGDFLQDRISTDLGGVNPTYTPGTTFAPLNECLPDYVINAMKQAITSMDRQLKGFASYDAVLTGAETRSSSPVRIVRDSVLLECGISGLYPCGEGAGYAGGIMSAAVDGIRCAEQIIQK